MRSFLTANSKVKDNNMSITRSIIQGLIRTVPVLALFRAGGWLVFMALLAVANPVLAKTLKALDFTFVTNDGGPFSCTMHYRILIRGKNAYWEEVEVKCGFFKISNEGNGVIFKHSGSTSTEMSCVSKIRDSVFCEDGSTLPVKGIRPSEQFDMRITAYSNLSSQKFNADVRIISSFGKPGKKKFTMQRDTSMVFSIEENSCRIEKYVVSTTQIGGDFQSSSKLKRQKNCEVSY